MDTEIYSKRLSVSDKELLLRYLAKHIRFGLTLMLLLILLYRMCLKKEWKNLY